MWNEEGINEAVLRGFMHMEGMERDEIAKGVYVLVVVQWLGHRIDRLMLCRSV